MKGEKTSKRVAGLASEVLRESDDVLDMIEGWMDDLKAFRKFVVKARRVAGSALTQREK